MIASFPGLARSSLACSTKFAQKAWGSSSRDVCRGIPVRRASRPFNDALAWRFTLKEAPRGRSDGLCASLANCYKLRKFRTASDERARPGNEASTTHPASLWGAICKNILKMLIFIKHHLFFFNIMLYSKYHDVYTMIYVKYHDI